MEEAQLRGGHRVKGAVKGVIVEEAASSLRLNPTLPRDDKLRLKLLG